MRKLILTLAALAAFGIALPVISNPADARDKVIIVKKRHYDRGLHAGWYRRHYHDRYYWRHRDHPRASATVIVR